MNRYLLTLVRRLRVDAAGCRCTWHSSNGCVNEGSWSYPAGLATTPAGPVGSGMKRWLRRSPWSTPTRRRAVTGWDITVREWQAR